MSSVNFRYGWSRSKRAWESLADALRKRAWKSSPFCKLWRDKIPAVPGVYIITGSPPITGTFSKAWCPLYVGQTLNLRSRFGHHLKGGTGVDSIRHFGELHFYYLGLRDDASSGHLRRYEQMLLDAFGPVGNTRNAIRHFSVGEPIAL